MPLDKQAQPTLQKTLISPLVLFIQARRQEDAKHKQIKNYMDPLECLAPHAVWNPAGKKIHKVSTAFSVSAALFMICFLHRNADFKCFKCYQSTENNGSGD